MIKTLVYTTEFLHNLSKYKRAKSQPIDPVPLVSPPEQISNQSYVTISETPYEPKFKSVDLQIETQKKPLSKSIYQPQFSRTDRILNLRPDLSNQIEDAKSRVNLEIGKQENIMKTEQNAIENAQKMYQEFRENVKGQTDECKLEQLELLNCFSNGTDFTVAMKNWKSCLGTF